MNIQEHEIEIQTLHQAASRREVTGLGHIRAQPFQVRGDLFAQQGVILNDQDA